MEQREGGGGGEGGGSIDNCRVARIYSNNSATVTGKSPTRPITFAWVAALARTVRYWRSGTGTTPEPCHPPIPRCAFSAARLTKHKGECPAIRRDGMPKGHDPLWSMDIELQCDVAFHQHMSCSTLYHTIMHWLMERVGEEGWEQGISLQAPVPDLPSWITLHLQIIHCLWLGQRFY